MKKLNKQEQGKKNKVSGRAFELKVRKEMESKGWVISKWMNQVEFAKDEFVFDGKEKVNISKVPKELEGKDVDKLNKDYKRITGKLIQAKHKFRGPGIPMAMGTGFPDFIAFRKDFWIFEPKSKLHMKGIGVRCKGYGIIGVEAKSNGYLDKKEKEKCKWLLENSIFDMILIASKSEKKGEIVYEDFSEKYK